MEQNRQPSPTSSSRADDEISLVDLWLILVQYKWVFFGIFLVCLAVGLTIALITPRTYNYFTSIEIGQREDASTPIEPLGAVAAKLNESYIPRILHEYKNQNPDEESIHEITARIPKDSGLVIIEAEGTVDSAPTRLLLIENVITQLKNDHDRITNLQRTQMDARMQAANLSVEKLKDEAELIVSRFKRLDDVERLLTEQITELSEQINSSLEYRKQAITNTASEPQAMTLLLIDSELEKNRTRLANLEKQLHIDLKNDRESLQKQLADNRRSQEQKLQDIKTLEMEKAAMMDTRVLIEPTQSLLPKGPRRTLIVALAGVLGLMAGLFGAFFAAFLVRARRQMAERADGSP